MGMGEGRGPRSDEGSREAKSALGNQQVEWEGKGTSRSVLQTSSEC